MYDYVIITNQPAFYKINLYNKLNEQLNIFVIFLGEGSLIRNKDFTDENISFEYAILNNENYEERSKVKSCKKIFNLLRNLNYKKVLIGGWDEIEYWSILFLSPKYKNALVIESSYYESKTTGAVKIVKKLFLSRIGTIFASGEDQIKLVHALNYNGSIIKTRGVGIFNKGQRTIDENTVREFKFICVARLSPEKNLDLLIEVFNKTGDKLLIIGEGDLMDSLKKKANENISFLGYVPNKEIAKFYSECNIFILPSKFEPWGLVVDEALYFGLPVIVSNHVGCRGELVEVYDAGCVFKYNDSVDLITKIKKVKNNYDYFRQNVLKIDFNKRDRLQIQSYVDEVKNN